MKNILELCSVALTDVEHILNIGHDSVRDKLIINGKISNQALETEQFMAHGFAWLAIYIEALKQILDWEERLYELGELGELESLIIQAAYGEYLNQIVGGIAISQSEIVRPSDIGINDDALSCLNKGASQQLRVKGNTSQVRSQIANLIINGKLHYFFVKFCKIIFF